MEKNTKRLKTQLALFGNVRVMALSAMLTAMSVVLAVLAKFLFGTGVLRVTFENLPVIFGSLAFGPFIGAAIAVAADLLSCLVAAQPPLPLITVGAFLMGAVSGLLGYVFRSRNIPSLLAVTLLTHLVGTICVKTLVLAFSFGTEWSLLAWRAPLYAGIALFEGIALYLIFRNREIRNRLERLYEKS